MIEDSVIIEKIQEFSKHGNIRFKKHALIRAVERNIKIEEISEALQSCGIIKYIKKTNH